MKCSAIRGLCAVAVMALALAIAVSAATTTTKSAGTLKITITDKAISLDPKNPKGDMDYDVIIKNNSSKARGLRMWGRDKVGSDYVRYTKCSPRASRRPSASSLPPVAR